MFSHNFYDPLPGNEMLVIGTTMDLSRVIRYLRTCHGDVLSSSGYTDEFVVEVLLSRKEFVLNASDGSYVRVNLFDKIVINMEDIENSIRDDTRVIMMSNINDLRSTVDDTDLLNGTMKKVVELYDLESKYNIETIDMSETLYTFSKVQKYQRKMEGSMNSNNIHSTIYTPISTNDRRFSLTSVIGDVLRNK